MNNEKIAGSDIQVDIPTLISISIFVFIIQNILHEFCGHGVVTLLVGGKIISWSTAYLEHDLSSVGEIGRQTVSAAGPIVNMLFGLLFWAILKNQKRKTSGLTFFLWLSMTVNLLTGTGYFLFSGATGVGDWNSVIKYFDSYWFWRITLIIVGIFLYLFSIWVSLKELNMFIGADEPNRNKLAFKLSFIPYLSGSIATTIGAFFNAISLVFVLTSAASTFGGTSGLAWMTQLYSKKLFPKIDKKAIIIKRNWYWITISAIFLLIHIFVIGPSIKF